MTRSSHPFLSIKDLKEANQIEHLFRGLVLKRIQLFENWLIRNSFEKEMKPTFVVFGHAQYFKYLLKKSEEMRNCDIWVVTAEIDDRTGTISWGNPCLKYRSPLSYLHPIQVFKEYLFGLSSSDMSSPGDQGSPPGEGELSCRICQVNPPRLIISFV
jgi:hypothetical protein